MFRFRAVTRATRLFVPVALCSLVFGLGSALAAERDHADHQKFGDISVFATFPFPGQPFGITVDTDRFYISTARGDFFAGQLNSAGERVFTYDEKGTLLHTTRIATMPDSDMGLFGLALDGNPHRTHKLYVADTNGRILTLDLSRPNRPRTDADDQDHGFDLLDGLI